MRNLKYRELKNLPKFTHYTALIRYMYLILNSTLAHYQSLSWYHTFFFFFKFYLFIYLFMAVLGLRLCARALSSCGKWGPLFITVRGPLTIAASLVAEHRLQTHKLRNCGSRA